MLSCGRSAAHGVTVWDCVASVVGVRRSLIAGAGRRRGCSLGGVQGARIDGVARDGALSRLRAGRARRAGRQFGRATRCVACTTAAVLGGVLAQSTNAATGTLKQEPGRTGCISDPGASPCAAGRALEWVDDLAVSADGTSVYAAVLRGDAVSVFDRREGGRLLQKHGRHGCVVNVGRGRCGRVRSMDAPEAIAVSPDGHNVYVAALISQAVAVLDRDQDGTLTQPPGRAGCVSRTGATGCADGRGLVAALDVAISPDGHSVYVASARPDAIAVFDRTADGTLRQRHGRAGCISVTGADGCAKAAIQAGVLAISPGGRNLYVAGEEGTITTLDRSLDGTLHVRNGAAGCLSTRRTRCTRLAGNYGFQALAISPDGSSVYAAHTDRVTVLDRAPDGALTGKQGRDGCIADAARPCTQVRGLSQPRAIAVDPDGKYVYVASLGDATEAGASGALAVLNRAKDGTLTQQGGKDGCLELTNHASCAIAAGIADPRAITTAPDGKNVYVASGVGRTHPDVDTGAIAIFDRDPGGPNLLLITILIGDGALVLALAGWLTARRRR